MVNASNTTESKSVAFKTIPPLCQIWRSIDDALPRCSILGMDISLTIASALGLAIVRYTAEQMLELFFHWPSNALTTKNAASSLAAIVHSLLLVPSLIVCFQKCQQYNPSERIIETPQWWQQSATALLQFCTGYMIYDGCYNILWLKSQMQEGGIHAEDILFLGHHIVTALYMTSTRIQKAGHQSAMTCMLIGELTNPLHNSFFFLQIAQGLDCCNGPLTQFTFQWVRVTFSGMYVLVRAILAPFVLEHVTINLWWTGRKYIHWSLILVWSLLIWAILLGSIPWIEECYMTLEEYGFPQLTATTTNNQQGKEEL